MYKVIKLQRIPGGRASMLLGRLRNSRTIRTAATATAVLAAISILAVALTGPSKMMADDDDARTLTVDVAFRNPFYQNNVDPAETLTDATAFSQGDTFIQYGNIYPGGTIPEGKTPF